MSRKGFFLHDEIMPCSDDLFCNTLQKCWIPWQLSSMPQNSTFRTVNRNDKFGEFITCQPYSAEEPRLRFLGPHALISEARHFLPQLPLTVPLSSQQLAIPALVLVLFFSVHKRNGFFSVWCSWLFSCVFLAPSFSEAPFSSHFGLLLRWIIDTSRQVVSKLTWEAGAFRDGHWKWIQGRLGESHDKTGLQEGQNMGPLMPRA